MNGETKYPNLADALAGVISGYTVSPDPTPEERAASEDSDRKQLVRRIAVDRGVPVKLAREVSREKPGHRCESTHALEATMGWLSIDGGENHREILALSGQRGRGKSYAAAHALSRVPPGSGCPRWANARHVADWLHRTDDSSGLHLQRIISAPMLVLDDLGWEHLDRSGYARGAFIGLIDDRIQNELRTILTTNMDEPAFRDRYGEALHDRVRGYGLWVDVEAGPSLR